MDQQTLVILVLGLVAGFLGGMFGIGGGLIIVPALMMLVDLPQKEATGTSLAAQLLPVGVLSTWAYYQSGNITGKNIRFALLIAIGLFIGGFFGAKTMIGLDPATAKRVYALFLILVAGKMLISGK